VNAIKKPAVVGPRAGIKIDGYRQNTPLSPACQAFIPVSWLIRTYFIENFVSQQYTRDNSLRVDCLLVLAEFLEGRCGHEWN